MTDAAAAALEQARADAVALERARSDAAALEHARSLFIYHAGQRLTTIRYFFVAYAIFIAAYANAYFGAASRAAAGGPDLHWPLSVIGALAAFVVLVFWALDVRNSEIVGIDERALTEVEGRLSDELQLSQINITRACDCPKRAFFQYRNIVPLMYAAFLLFALGLAVVPHFGK